MASLNTEAVHGGESCFPTAHWHHVEQISKCSHGAAVNCGLEEALLMESPHRSRTEAGAGACGGVGRLRELLPVQTVLE